eukprot:7480_1
MSHSEKEEKFARSYTFKICGIDKEVSLELTGETSIQQILQQLSSFCEIKSSALQIRNGNENLNDINKTLNQYIIEDPSNFLVLRDDILDGKDNESKESEEEEEEEEEDDDDEDEEDVNRAIHMHSNDGSLDFVQSELISIKSPDLPSVPPNSFATESGIIKHQSQGLYSALEALSNAKSTKELNSLSHTKKN